MSSSEQNSGMTTQPLPQAEIARLGLFALGTDDLDGVMHEVASVVVEVLGVELCKVLMLQPDRQTFIVQAGRGWKAGVVGSTVVPAGAKESQAGHTLATSEPVIVNDIEAETRFSTASILKDHDVRTGISVAIKGSEEPLGVLAAHATTARNFSESDIHFLQSAANVLAGAIERHRVEQALRESEAKARAVLNTTVDGIITIDAFGHIESFNPAAERIFGYEAAEVIGQNVSVLMPQPYKEEHDEYLRSYRETGRRKIIGIGREVVGRRKDGSTFPLDLAVSEVQLEGRRLFTGVVRDITDRRQLEQEILSISEQERRRIGQDLHDGLGQMLTGIGLITRNLARTLSRSDEQHAEDVAEVADLIQEADEFARGLARGLIPVDLEASGLRSALQRLATGAEKLFGIRCTFEEMGRVLVEDNTIATHVFRIAQEAVSNAVKHGRADHVKIRLAGSDRQLRLRVEDDGVGFPDDAGERTNGGMGVPIMRHRARIIGAHLEIIGGVDGGTMITCTVQNHRNPLRMGGEEYGRT